MDQQEQAQSPNDQIKKKPSNNGETRIQKVTEEMDELERKMQDALKNSSSHTSLLAELNERINTFHATLSEVEKELEEKEKKSEKLERENQELRENTIKELEEQLTAKNTEAEAIKKKLEEERKRPRFGKGAGALTALTLALLGLGILWFFFGIGWFAGKSSPPDQVASTSGGDILVGGEGKKNVPVHGLGEEDMITTLFHKKYPDARIVTFLTNNELIFCESVDKGLISRFELKKANYENGGFREWPIPQNKIFGDGRSQPPCFNSEL